MCKRYLSIFKYYQGKDETQAPPFHKRIRFMLSTSYTTSDIQLKPNDRHKRIGSIFSRINQSILYAEDKISDMRNKGRTKGAMPSKI